MIQRLLSIILFLCLAVRVEGAMARVLEVIDGRTIVVERRGERTTIALAGITLTNEAEARATLTWTLANAWVSIESVEGGFFVYRSPDALFLNRELVERGFARATLPGVESEQRVPVTYLGQLRPTGSRREMTAPPNGTNGNGSGGRARSSTRPTRPPRARRSRPK